MSERFKGVINVDIRDSVPDWAPFEAPKAPEGAPNVLYIVLDDVGFSVLSSYGGPSYWEQVMLAHDHGTTVVDDTVSGTQGLVTLVTRTGSKYYLTVVNTEGSAHRGSISLSGVRSTSDTASAVTLSGPAEYSTNWINTPTTITPVDSTVRRCVSTVIRVPVRIRSIRCSRRSQPVPPPMSF